MRTQSNDYPSLYSVSGVEKHHVIITDMATIEEIQTEDGKAYVYQSYQFDTFAPEEYISANAETLLGLLKTREYDELANEIREKRNKLLDESDKYMALDRVGLDTSSAIAFLASLKNIFNNSMSTYRQSLRDITKQPNFPYEVTWPQKPE